MNCYFSENINEPYHTKNANSKGSGELAHLHSLARVLTVCSMCRLRNLRQITPDLWPCWVTAPYVQVYPTEVLKEHFLHNNTSIKTHILVIFFTGGIGEK